MLTISRRVCSAVLGLALLFVAMASTTNAQSFGRLSNGEKAGYIAGGAAAGAVIGGLLGGTKGAVIGGLLGAGGGTGYVYYKNQRDNDRYFGYRGHRDYDYRRVDRDDRFGRYYGDRRWDHRDREGDRDDRFRWNRDRDDYYRSFHR